MKYTEGHNEDIGETLIHTRFRDQIERRPRLFNVLTPSLPSGTTRNVDFTLGHAVLKFST